MIFLDSGISETWTHSDYPDREILIFFFEKQTIPNSRMIPVREDSGVALFSTGIYGRFILKYKMDKTTR
jgi:hypothetical protein